MVTYYGALQKLEEFNRKASVRSMAGRRGGNHAGSPRLTGVSDGCRAGPCGSRAGAVRPLLWYKNVRGLSAVLRSHENAGKTAPARLVKIPGPLRIYGHRTEIAKITVFTRRTGPLMDM